MNLKSHHKVTSGTLDWLESQLADVAMGDPDFDGDEAQALLDEWKPALVTMTHGRLMRWLARKNLLVLTGDEVYETMTPDELVAAANAHADALESVAQERVREHMFVKNLWQSVSMGLSNKLLQVLAAAII